MKAILISIQPRWVAKILNGEKTIEIRKSIPKCDLPIDVYIYCTKKEPYARRYVHNDKWGTLEYIKSDGKVVAKFTLNKVEKIITIGMYYHETKTLDKNELPKLSCLTRQELDNYLQGENGYAWHIDNLVIFDKPKEISEFENRTLTRPRNINPCVIANGYFVRPLTRAPQSWCYIEI